MSQDNPTVGDIFKVENQIVVLNKDGYNYGLGHRHSCNVWSGNLDYDEVLAMGQYLGNIKDFTDKLFELADKLEAKK